MDMKNTRLGDIPPFECVVRREFLRAHKDGHGEYENGIAIGAVVRKDAALCFTVLLESGALWYELPIHAVALKEGPTIALPTAQMWDCLSDNWTAHCYDHLRHLNVSVKLNGNDDLDPMMGDYMFTIDFMDSFYADHPGEHKTLNIIGMPTGAIVAYPNNRCVFADKTFTKPLPRNYLRSDRHYFCEEQAANQDPGRAWTATEVLAHCDEAQRRFDQAVHWLRGKNMTELDKEELVTGAGERIVIGPSYPRDYFTAGADNPESWDVELPGEAGDVGKGKK